MQAFVPRRRQAICWLAATAAFAATPLRAAKPDGTARDVDVWKDPQCGCCQDWIVHLQRNGFRVRTQEDSDGQARERLGMPIQYGSCHTARVGAYLIEGHVPAADILRLLREQPDALGLAVPGMPIGSPGMDGPVYGGRRDRYATLLIQRDGASRVFQTHG